MLGQFVFKVRNKTFKFTVYWDMAYWTISYPDFTRSFVLYPGTRAYKRVLEVNQVKWFNQLGYWDKSYDELCPIDPTKGL